MTDFEIIERSRLSGPGLRAFAKIAELWELNETQRVAALGHPDQSTYRNWVIRANAVDAVTIPRDTLMRISAMLGIHKALQSLLTDRARVLEWLESPHRGAPFQNSRPLDLIVHGGLEGLMTVRRYLEGWCEGHIGQGVPEGSFVPVTEEDITFV